MKWRLPSPWGLNKEMTPAWRCERLNLGEEEEERWRQKTEGEGEAEKVVGDAGPEPRVRRAARRHQKRQASGLSTEPTGRRAALKKGKVPWSRFAMLCSFLSHTKESHVCVLPPEPPFPHPPTALGQLPAPPSVITGRAQLPGLQAAPPAAPLTVMCIVSPQPPPRSSHPLLPHPYPHVHASCLCISASLLSETGSSGPLP